MPKRSQIKQQLSYKSRPITKTPKRRTMFRSKRVPRTFSSTTLISKTHFQSKEISSDSYLSRIYTPKDLCSKYATTFSEFKINKVELLFQPDCIPDTDQSKGYISAILLDGEALPSIPSDFVWSNFVYEQLASTRGVTTKRDYQSIRLRWLPTEPSHRDWFQADDKTNKLIQLFMIPSYYDANDTAVNRQIKGWMTLTVHMQGRISAVKWKANSLAKAIATPHTAINPVSVDTDEHSISEEFNAIDIAQYDMC